jgi:uncharacterized protein involved in exopolysaccharide biosynthesis
MNETNSAIQSEESGPANKGGNSLPDLLWCFWRNKHWILLVSLGVGILAVIYSYFMTPIYTAEVSLLPQKEGAQTGILSSIAGIAGLTSGSGQSYETLYGEIFQSDRMLDVLIAEEWQYHDREELVSLFEVLAIKTDAKSAKGQRLAVYNIKMALRNRVIRFTRDKLTGYMKLQVSIPEDPVLAANIANFLIGHLNDYNRHLFQSRAGEQRRYIQTRLGETNIDLNLAEEKLTAFIKANRSYATSPELAQHYRLLKRDAEAQTSIWIELRRQFEMAKLDEHKDLMTVEILDEAVVPALRSSPVRSVMGIIATLIGFVSTILFIALRVHWQQFRRAHSV